MTPNEILTLCISVILLVGGFVAWVISRGDRRAEQEEKEDEDCRADRKSLEDKIIACQKDLISLQGQVGTLLEQRSDLRRAFEKIERQIEQIRKDMRTVIRDLYKQQ